jgi:hypothetical protein
MVAFFLLRKKEATLLQNENHYGRVGWVRERSERSHHRERPKWWGFCSAKNPPYSKISAKKSLLY